MTTPTPPRNPSAKIVGFILLSALLIVSNAGCPGAGGIDPNLYNSCDDLAANPLVSSARAQLASAGQAFTFSTGGLPSNIEGSWALTSGTVTFSQAGAQNRPLPAGVDSYAGQVGDGTIVWQASRTGNVDATSSRGFIQGNGNQVSVCILADVRQTLDGSMLTKCGLQIATFYTLTVAADGQSMSGRFLTVNLAVTTGDAACGAAGDFDSGTVKFNRSSGGGPALQLLGTVSLGQNDPTSIAVSPNGQIGFVGTANGPVVRFDVATRVATIVTFPNPNGIVSSGAVAISSVATNLGFPTGGDNRLLFYNIFAPVPQLEGNITPPTSPSSAAFSQQAVLFDSVASTAFAPVIFQLNRPAIAVVNSRAGSTPVGVTSVIPFNQDGLQQIRMRPDFGQIAAVLTGNTVPGKARFVGLVTLGNTPSVREVDITSQTFEDYNIDQLVYSANGASVFVTNGKVVHAVATSSPFGLSSTADLRDGNVDQLRHLAVSSDGKVLAVTIASSGNRANLALLNPSTFVELHRTRLPDASIGATGGNLMFFANSRIAAVDDGNGSITPFDTEAGFAVGAAVNAFAAPITRAIAGSAIGGQILAVANRSERTVYLFRLTGR